jgi:lipoprotein-anchoring transpeptidase ErfK/SrfK
VSIPDRKIALIDGGKVVKVFAVAVGKESTPSPEGTFTVKSRVEKPTYYHKGKVIAPGAQNPLGSRWMGLSEKGYGIHGTNEPKSIGKAASHGCIRMAKKDLEELFPLVKVGDTVEIRGDRDDEMSQIFGVESDAPTSTTVVAAAQSSTVPVAATGM